MQYHMQITTNKGSCRIQIAHQHSYHRSFEQCRGHRRYVQNFPFIYFDNHVKFGGCFSCSVGACRGSKISWGAVDPFIKMGFVVHHPNKHAPPHVLPWWRCSLK